MAYVLGYFAADGSMLKNRRGGHYIEFTTTDRILLRHVQNATGSNHKVTRRSSKNKNWKTQYRLQIGSNHWFDSLRLFGFTQSKSNTLCFPKIPEKYVADFVRGYFDGDGCVYFKKLKYADRVSKRWILMSLFTSGSRPFLKTLHELLKRQGVLGGSIKNKVRGFELVFSHKDSLALYLFIYHNTKVTGLYLPRKYQLFSKAIKTLYPDAAVV